MSSNKTENDGSNAPQKEGPDEDVGVMVFGNLRIVDVKTGEILVNKRA